MLRVRPGVVVSRHGSGQQHVGRMSRTYSMEAGQATLFLELRDSSTGALLGRALDSARHATRARAGLEQRHQPGRLRAALQAVGRHQRQGIQGPALDVPVPTDLKPGQKLKIERISMNIRFDGDSGQLRRLVSRSQSSAAHAGQRRHGVASASPTVGPPTSRSMPRTERLDVDFERRRRQPGDGLPGTRGRQGERLGGFVDVVFVAVGTKSTFTRSDLNTDLDLTAMDLAFVWSPGAERHGLEALRRPALYRQRLSGSSSTRRPPA